jgi:hypothetical protein
MLFDFIRSASSAHARTDRHRLAGTVKINGVPGKMVVCVFVRDTFTLLATKYSDTVTGAFEFVGLPEYSQRGLFVLAFDRDGDVDYNLQAFDYISQVAT